MPPPYRAAKSSSSFIAASTAGLWTLWRNPDGSWSKAQELGGALTGDPIATAIPGTDILQVIYRGTDSGLWTRWRNSDGAWSDEQALGGVVVGHPSTSVVPGTRVLQLFYRGIDSRMWTRWRDADGSWSDEHNLGGVIHLRTGAGGEGARYGEAEDGVYGSMRSLSHIE